MRPSERWPLLRLPPLLPLRSKPATPNACVLRQVGTSARPLRFPLGFVRRRQEQPRRKWSEPCGRGYVQPCRQLCCGGAWSCWGCPRVSRACAGTSSAGRRAAGPGGRSPECAERSKPGLVRVGGEPCAPSDPGPFLSLFPDSPRGLTRPGQAERASREAAPEGEGDPGRETAELGQRKGAQVGAG